MFTKLVAGNLCSRNHSSFMSEFQQRGALKEWVQCGFRLYPASAERFMAKVCTPDFFLIFQLEDQRYSSSLRLRSSPRTEQNEILTSTR